MMERQCRSHARGPGSLCQGRIEPAAIGDAREPIGQRVESLDSLWFASSSSLVQAGESWLRCLFKCTSAVLGNQKIVPSRRMPQDVGRTVLGFILHRHKQCSESRWLPRRTGRCSKVTVTAGHALVISGNELIARKAATDDGAHRIPGDLPGVQADRGIVATCSS